MTNPIEALRSAHRLHQQGAHAEAATLLRQVLAKNGQNPDALHLLGLCLHAQGDSAEGLKQIRNAISVRPMAPILHTHAGAIAVGLGEIAWGIESYRRAIELDPAYPDAYNNLGVALQALGHLEEAEAILQRAVALRPNAANPLVNLGNALLALGRTEDAIVQYRRAIEISPKLAEAHNNLGNALRALRSHRAAVECFDRALAIRPAYSEAHCGRALALASLGDTEAALKSVQRAITIRRDPRYLLVKAGMMSIIPRSRADICEWRDRFVAGIKDLLAENFRMSGSPLDSPIMSFYMAYHGENDRDVMMLLSDFFRQAFPVLQWTAPHCTGGPPRVQGRRVRLGLFSAYMRDHAVARTVRGLLEQLPHDRFEIVVFTVHQPVGGVMPEIFAAVDKVVTVRRSLEQARAEIAEERLDVLMFADIGMEAVSYSLAHARLAPVQCATWGHPVTTGISTVDYYISSDMAEPADAQEHYSETLVRLAGVQTCYRRPEFPVAGIPASADIPAGATIYLCPQSLFKIHPDMDAPLAEILRRDPGGILLLFDGSDKLITDRLRARWREPFAEVRERVRFLPRMSVDGFLAVLASADVLLDTWPFGGGNTSYQGFAAGIPIVTLPGKYLRGRGALAHYRHMGFDDCVAETPSSYVDIAVRLGTDRAFYSKISALIAERSGVLFDDARVGADLARFLLEVSA